MIDWQKIVLDIRRHLSCRKIDKLVGVHLDYTAKLARAEIKEPRYSDGVKLLDLHRKVCGQGVPNLR